MSLDWATARISVQVVIRNRATVIAPLCVVGVKDGITHLPFEEDIRTVRVRSDRRRGDEEVATADAPELSRNRWYCVGRQVFQRLEAGRASWRGRGEMTSVAAA